MTAGHNIVHPKSGRAKTVDVTFPEGLEFTAKDEDRELFVSEVYAKEPTDDKAHSSSLSDYGLIAVARKKNPSDLTGCAFSAALSERELSKAQVAVHGYMEGAKEQTKNDSPLNWIDARSLSYVKDTKGGVSGGPVFISQGGTYVAIGIQ